MFPHQREKSLRVLFSLLEFGARVDVFGVLPKDHHVHRARVPHRGGHALEPAHRPQADVEVEHLADGHVQRPDPAAHRRCQRALDRDPVFADGVDGLVGQPGIELLPGGLARVGFHPHELPLAAVCGGHRGVQHPLRGPPDIAAGAVPADERDDGRSGTLSPAPFMVIFWPCSGICILAFLPLSVARALSAPRQATATLSGGRSGASGTLILIGGFELSRPIASRKDNIVSLASRERPERRRLVEQLFDEHAGLASFSYGVVGSAGPG